MHDRLNGYPEGEYATKKKKFKLFEKRRYNFTTAKTFCKNRGGRLAQGSLSHFIIGFDNTSPHDKFRFYCTITKINPNKKLIWTRNMSFFK